MSNFGSLMTMTGTISAAALAVGLAWQAIGGAEPCPWCTLQRAIYAAILLVALLAAPLAAAGAFMRGVLGVLSLALAVAGAAAAAWQSFFLKDAASCALTAADRIMNATGLPALWPYMFAATASCDQANVLVARIPMSVWSLAIFVLLAAIAGLAMVSGIAFTQPASRRSVAPYPR